MLAFIIPVIYGLGQIISDMCLLICKTRVLGFVIATETTTRFVAAQTFPVSLLLIMQQWWPAFWVAGPPLTTHQFLARWKEL